MYIFRRIGDGDRETDKRNSCVEENLITKMVVGIVRFLPLERLLSLRRDTFKIMF